MRRALSAAPPAPLGSSPSGFGRALWPVCGVPRVAGLLSLMAAAGCGVDKAAGGGDDSGASAPAREIDRVCPGDAGCEGNEGPLRAGAAALDLTPTCFESWEDLEPFGEYDAGAEVFYDCGCDRLCPGDEGYTVADQGEGDGVFQAIWLAGFGQGRAATGVHDPIEARAVVVSSGDTSVGIVTLDTVGWFFDDTVAVRDAAAALGADIDLIVVHATHNHEGPDTMGQWGERFGVRGVDPAYRQAVIDGAAAAVAEAAAAQVDVTMRIGAGDSAAPFGSRGTRNTIRDSRDPVIIDEQVGVAELVDGAGATVATLINWGNHPEVLSDENTLITSDFVHYLRGAVEGGVPDLGLPGRGGVAVFLNAAVGGLMTPLGITVQDWAGVDHGESDFAKAQALGEVVGGVALQALDAAEAAESPRVSFKAEGFNLVVENYGFQALFLIGVFERAILNYDPSLDIGPSNTPEVATEMDLITIGPLRMLTVPGELAPELAIGGYDGSRVGTEEDEFISAENPAPPDVASAPGGPYLKDQMAGGHNWIIGLGNDEIGYLIPPYDYVLDPRSPYLAEAEGDHYEETNSLGPSTVPKLLEVATLLTAEP